MRVFPILLLLAIFLGALPSNGAAQTAEDMVETPLLMLERWDAEAAFIERHLADETLGAAEIEGFRATLEGQMESAPELITNAEWELEPLHRQIIALGEPPEEPDGESKEIATRRANLAVRTHDLEAVIKRAGQADARADALITRLSDLRRKLFSRELLARGPGLFDAGVQKAAVESLGRVVVLIGAETLTRISAIQLDVAYVLRILISLALVGVALFMVLGAKRVALHWLMQPSGKEAPNKRRVLIGIGVMLVRLLMPTIVLILILVAIWNSGFLGPRGEHLVLGLSRMVIVVIGAYALGGAFYSPHAPQLRLSGLPEKAAVTAHRRMMVLAAIVGLDGPLVAKGGELGLSIEAETLLNTGLLVLGGIAIWGFTRHLPTRAPTDESASPPQSDEDIEDEYDGSGDAALGPILIKVARILSRTVAVIAPALALMGFFTASRFIFYPMVFSGAVIGTSILLFYAVQDSVDRFIAPEGKVVRQQSRIRLIPVAVAFLLFSASLPVLALIWGADMTDLASIWRRISAGFAIGETVISPLDFLSFLLVFSTGFVLVRVLQRIIKHSVLPLTGLDTGGKAAINAGVGYIGITLAALVAISTTGLDLSNLAIVAGALSVGIGFGLQNVVNNFVSGLILLIERPIKAGDWIELASGMGYVRKVNVRSTEIQTFDRAALIVPNSELISAPVTNWTHTNLNGRVIIPVGVAYGTDPRQVEMILTEIAMAQPLLLHRPAPYVLFRRFGDDALEFELRGVLRDVNWILNVTSDINFEIWRRFAEEGIEIPFAQRDLHIRNADELGQSIGDALRGKQKTESEPSAPPSTLPRRPAGPSEAAGNDPGGDY